MTTTLPAVPARTAASAHPRLLVTGVAVAVLLAIGSVVSTLPFLAVMPLVLAVTTVVLAAAALVGAVPAVRARLWGWWLVAGSTLLAGISSAPVYLAPEVPGDVVTATTIANVVTVLALALLVAGRPRTRR